MKKIIIFITIICFTLFSIIIPNVHADSGWDGDFDSSWTNSDWGDSDFGFDIITSFVASSSDSGMFSIIFLFLLIIISYIIKVKLKKTKYKEEHYHVKAYDVNKIKDVLPNFGKLIFKQQAFKIYKEIQNAWMNFDYEKLRKYTTDELYNMYHSQLVALNVKKQKNIMKDFKLNDFEIIGMEHNSNTISLKVYMNVECYDYIIDKNNKVLRGKDYIKVNYLYEMTFIKGTSEKQNKCPNCNAPLDNVNSSKCSYCDSIIISDNYDWVLSKKQVKKQTYTK